MTEVKGVGRTQLLDDLRNNRRYWELKEEVEDRNRWKWQFISQKHKEEIQVLKQIDNWIKNTSYLPQFYGPANK